MVLIPQVRTLFHAAATVETSNCSPPDAMLAGLSRYFLGLAVIVIGVVS